VEVATSGINEERIADKCTIIHHMNSVFLAGQITEWFGLVE
jgi:hypothetical protein